MLQDWKVGQIRWDAYVVFWNLDNLATNKSNIVKLNESK